MVQIGEFAMKRHRCAASIRFNGDSPADGEQARPRLQADEGSPAGELVHRGHHPAGCDGGHGDGLIGRTQLVLSVDIATRTIGASATGVGSGDPLGCWVDRDEEPSPRHPPRGLAPNNPSRTNAR
jgi:hypothetical protein